MDPSLPTVRVPQNDKTAVDKTPIIKLEKAIGYDSKVVEDKSKGDVMLVIKSIPWPPPPFPQWMKQKKDKGKFKKFIDMPKELSLNIPLLKALEQIPGYAKLMKYLVTKKQTTSFEKLSGLHHCSAVTSRSLAQKEVDPNMFTIPHTIGTSLFARSLCYIGSNIYLMLLAMFR